jgi:cellulose synthase/poly-beta-1,6-N-acetylglucosamine synthase-like glycosyltransferase
MLDCSIGIMAYNEENTIGPLLQVLIQQQCKHIIINEIVVVASGCTDRTEDIVREFSQKDNRIKLLIQRERKGKASAINMFLLKTTSEIIVLSSADILPEHDAIERLVIPFQNTKIGMTGGRATPINPKDTFMGFTVHLLWELHHEISLEHPKLGEVIAFRKIFDQITEETAVDEAYIESCILKSGLQLCYVPEAIIRNKGAETAKDFIKQRRRIAAGHLHLKHTTTHQVSTRSPMRIIKLLLKKIPREPKYILWSIGAMALEAWARFLGYIDIFLHKNPVIWPIAKTTKKMDK